MTSLEVGERALNRKDTTHGVFVWLVSLEIFFAYVFSVIIVYLFSVLFCCVVLVSMCMCVVQVLFLGFLKQALTIYLWLS